MAKLKACPFCSAEDGLKIFTQGQSRYFVRCQNCWASGPMSLTKKDAITSWNEAIRKKKSTPALQEKIDG